MKSVRTRSYAKLVQNKRLANTIRIVNLWRFQQEEILEAIGLYSLVSTKYTKIDNFQALKCRTNVPIKKSKVIPVRSMI